MKDQDLYDRMLAPYKTNAPSKDGTRSHIEAPEWVYLLVQDLWSMTNACERTMRQYWVRRFLDWCEAGDREARSQALRVFIDRAQLRKLDTMRALDAFVEAVGPSFHARA